METRTSSKGGKRNQKSSERSRQEEGTSTTFAYEGRKGETEG